MVLMIAYYNTNAYRIISSWTPSSLLRRADAPLEGTHVANSLALCHGQRIPIHRPNAKEIGSPSSDQTVRQGNWGAYLDHCRYVW